MNYLITTGVLILISTLTMWIYLCVKYTPYKKEQRILINMAGVLVIYLIILIIYFIKRFY